MTRWPLQACELARRTTPWDTKTRLGAPAVARRTVRIRLVLLPGGCTYSDRGPDQGFPSGSVRLVRNPRTVPMMADGSLLRSGGETWGPVSPENVHETRCLARWAVWISPRGRRGRAGPPNWKKDLVTGPIRGCALQAPLATMRRERSVGKHAHALNRPEVAMEAFPFGLRDVALPGEAEASASRHPFCP